MDRVLLIEDEEVARCWMRDILETAGYEVIEAVNGEDGLAQQRACPAGVVVTDIFMPTKDGVETIVDLRREFPEVPIIAVSGGGAMGNLDFLRFAKAFGACRVLPKPFGPEELLDAVRSCLGAPASAAGGT